MWRLNSPDDENIPFVSEPEGLAKATFQVGPKHINALQTMHGAFAMLLLDVLTILGLQAHVSFFGSSWGWAVEKVSEGSW